VENRHGLIVNTEVFEANGTAERDAALVMLEQIPGTKQRWTRDYAAPRAPGEPRGRKWRGRPATGKSTWPARAEGEKRLRSATRNP